MSLSKICDKQENTTGMINKDTELVMITLVKIMMIIMMSDNYNDCNLISEL